MQAARKNASAGALNESRHDVRGRITSRMRERLFAPKAEGAGMKLSARNQLRGRVKSVRTGTIMAEVEVEIEAADVTAVITRGSVESVGLKVGDQVTVIIKSTEVMVGKE